MSDSSLPAILELLLDYLSDYLPPTVLDIVETLITHTWNVTTSLTALIFTMISSYPSSWDVEKILPPIITLLAAYLALVSFYRTTGWMIRTAFAFVKWGFILTTLGAAAGYILANGAHGAAGDGIGALGGGVGGLLSFFGGHFLDMISGGGSADTKSQSRTRTQNRSSGKRSKPQAQSGSRPKAWDSWDKHKDWQYIADGQGRDAAAEVQKIVGDVLGTAQKVMTDNKWWETAKEAVNDFQAKAEEAKKDGGKSRRQKKTSKSR